MTVGGALILYATAVGLAGPVGFRRADWPLRAPRLGAAAVVAAAWSVPVALVLAGVTMFLPAERADRRRRHLVGACLGRLRAAYGTPAGAGIVTAGQVLTVAILRPDGVGGRPGRPPAAHGAAATPPARPAGRWPRARTCRRSCSTARAPRPTASRVAGRTVVVTQGVVDLLTGPELSAPCSPTSTRTSRRGTTAGRSPPRWWPR